MDDQKPRGSKYEFPTRVLARAEKFIKTLLNKRNAQQGTPGYSETFCACFNLAQELILLRLMELNWILEDGWLSGWIEKGDLAGLFAELEQINANLGVKAFLPAQSRNLNLSVEEFRSFVHALYIGSFVSKKSPPEILGALIEKMELIHPEQAPFFTPDRLVRMMIAESFAQLDLDQGRLENQNFMIMDPSFGSGNFLLGLARKIISSEENFYAKRPSGLFYPLVRLADLSRSIESELRIELVRKHIFGLELSEAGKLSAIRSLLLVLLRGKSVFELKLGSLAFLDQNLALGDFLIDMPLREQIDLFERDRFGAIHPFSFTDAEHPHQQAVARGGFDLIIGNPPWLSLKGKRGMSPYSPEAVEWLISRYNADSYRPNLFEMFIRRALQLLGENGLNCFIVPDRMAENLQFQSLRQFMIERGDILRLHFREPFPGVVSDTLIYWFLKKQPAAKKILVTDATGRENEISQKKFATRGGGIEKELSLDVSGLLEKIRHEAKGKMADFFTIGVGLIGRPGSIHPEKFGHMEQPIIKGENVHRWKVSGHYFFEFHPRNLLGGTVRYTKLTVKQRILVRKTGIKLIAAADQGGDLVEQSAYFLIPRPGRKLKLALEYFLALINSPLLNFYYRNFLVTNPGSTPQLKKFHLDELPVKRLNLKDDQEKSIHERIVALVKQIYEAQNPEKQNRLEDELNSIIFKMYHLSSLEIKTLSQL